MENWEEGLTLCLVILQNAPTCAVSQNWQYSPVSDRINPVGQVWIKELPSVIVIVYVKALVGSKLMSWRYTIEPIPLFLTKASWVRPVTMPSKSHPFSLR